MAPRVRPSRGRARRQRGRVQAAIALPASRRPARAPALVAGDDLHVASVRRRSRARRSTRRCAVSTAPAVQIPKACSPAASQRSKATRRASPAAAGSSCAVTGSNPSCGRGPAPGPGSPGSRRARRRRAPRPVRRRRRARRRRAAPVGRRVGVGRAGVAVVDAQHRHGEVVDLRGLRRARDGEAREQRALAHDRGLASPSAKPSARSAAPAAPDWSCDPDLHVAKARGRGAVGDDHDLPGLALAAVGQPPQPPLARARRPRRGAPERGVTPA